MEARIDQVVTQIRGQAADCWSITACLDLLAQCRRFQHWSLALQHSRFLLDAICSAGIILTFLAFFFTFSTRAS